MLIQSTYPNFDYTKLKRTKEVETVYKDYLVDINRMYGLSPEEMVLRSEFSHPHQQIAISKNKFPYLLPDNQQHWLLWSKKKLTKSEIKKILNTYFNGKKIVAIWVNNPKDQSVKNLFHVHFIIED